MSEANKIQIGGDHYKKLPIEHWDLAILYGMDFWQYQITKYLLREKPGQEIADAEKVQHFAAKRVEIKKYEATHGPGSYKLKVLRDALARLRPQTSDPLSSSPGDAAEYAIPPPAHPSKRAEAIREWMHREPGQDCSKDFRCMLSNAHSGECALSIDELDADKLREGILQRKATEPSTVPAGVIATAEVKSTIGALSGHARPTAAFRSLFGNARQRVEALAAEYCGDCGRHVAREGHAPQCDVSAT